MAKNSTAVAEIDDAENLPMTIEEEMEAEAQEMRDNLQIATSKISTLNKAFTLPDGTMVGDTIQLVIVGYAAVNTMYESAEYVQGQANPVVCSAAVNMQNSTDADMVPFANSTDKQAEKCGGWKTPICPMNEYGSKGKGKRCKNEYALMVCLPTEDKIMELRVPPTATKAMAKYLGSIIKEFGHPAKAIVTFKFNPGFSYPLPIIVTADPNPMATEHFAIRKDAMDSVLG